jgi:hypothetical protein
VIEQTVGQTFDRPAVFLVHFCTALRCLRYQRRAVSESLFSLKAAVGKVAARKSNSRTGLSCIYGLRVKRCGGVMRVLAGRAASIWGLRCRRPGYDARADTQAVGAAKSEHDSKLCLRVVANIKRSGCACIFYNRLTHVRPATRRRRRL